MRDDGERAPLLNFVRDVHKGENDNKKSGRNKFWILPGLSSH
jgi:hypothetical protein